MSMLFDTLPIVLFLIFLKLYDVIVATEVAVVMTLLLIVFQKLRTGKVSKMMMLSGALMLVFGGLTIILKDETFIMWKPTILMGLFAIAFFLSRFIGEKPIAERMMEKAFLAPRKVWLRVNDGLGAFFIFLAGLNLYVAYNYSIETWATFKVFGFLGLNFIAVMVAAFYLNKHGTLLDPKQEEKAG